MKVVSLLLDAQGLELYRYSYLDISIRLKFHTSLNWTLSTVDINTVRTGPLNCLNARSRGLTFRHRASCI